jgi:chromosome segregation ATPase
MSDVKRDIVDRLMDEHVAASRTEAAEEITALRARVAEVEKEYAEYRSETEKREDEFMTMKDRAEAALATARRDALQSVLDNIREWAWPQDGTYPPEEQAIQNAERWTVEFIQSQIRAMKDAKP